MQRYTIGVDIGGTKIQAGLVSNKNKVVISRRFPINKKGWKSTVKSIVGAIDSVFSKQVRAIGVGITGQVELSTGIVKYSPNLPRNWKNIPLKRILTKKFKVPVSVDNDVHCIALAEAHLGAGKKYPVILGMTIGTGVGTALVVNKEIYRGAHNVIEFGHTIIGSGHVRCSCGLYDHFEALVSGPAMIRRYHELTGQRKTPLEIETAAKHNNPAAKKVFKEMATRLARGLADAIHSYNPSIIIVGGGLGKVTSLIKPAIKQVRQYIRYPGLQKTKIIMSKLKYDAGVLGAALITRQ